MIAPWLSSTLGRETFLDFHGQLVTIRIVLVIMHVHPVYDFLKVLSNQKVAWIL